MKSILPPTALVLVLSGCGSVVASTAAKLGMMSPLTADPGQIAVDLSLPEGIGISPDGATLTLFARQASTGETLNEVFVLSRQGDIYRLASSDLSRARAAQAQVRAWEDTDADDSSGGLSVNLSPCRTGNGPAPDATVSIAIQTRADGPFAPLVRNGPLSQVAGQDDLAQLPPC